MEEMRPAAENLAKLRPSVVTGLVLGGVTLAAFWPVRHFPFINYDDPLYVTENPVVQGGLSAQGLAWAFRTGYAANWHPLTWLSHMLDCQLFGLAAGSHHLMSLALHVANALLLFSVLRRMTGALWPSGAVAALFALHPLHVESVAWVAARKDVLSTFFWMLTLWAYVRYAHSPTRGRMAAVALFLMLGLLAKPMLVTLPLLLLLLDWWPLRRWKTGGEEEPGDSATTPRGPRFGFGYLLGEKAPLLALSLAACFMTYRAQSRGGAMADIERFPLADRPGNALVSYVRYLAKTLWPEGLSYLYPHPGQWPLPMVVAAGALLVGITGLALKTMRRHPHLAVGWFWFVGTLVPVIGVVQVGEQAMADRYTYVPLIGVFLAVAWSLDQWAASRPALRRALAWGGVALIAACFAATRSQSRHWRDSVALYQHALEVDPNHATAHYNLARTLSERGGDESAVMRHYEEAIRLRPSHASAHVNLGVQLLGLGRVHAAAQHLAEAMRLDPRSFNARLYIGLAYAAMGRHAEAVREAEEARRLAAASQDQDAMEKSEELLKLLRAGQAPREARQLGP